VATLQRIRVLISGLVGGPGVATFYAPDGDTTAVAALSAFYLGIKDLHAQNTSFQVNGAGDTIDELTGHINGVWTQSGGSTQTSASGSVSYAAGVGLRVRWLTGGIVHNRRVNGATFLVPMNSASYATDGTIIPATVTTIATQVSLLVANASLRIWSPPHTNSGPTDPIPTRLGSSYEVIAGLVVDRVSSLRSRRV
jgi:hypothetical protein